MRIKKFTGKSIVEALSKVKKEFGEKAVILNSEKVLIDGKPCYEITAAIEEEEVKLVSPSEEREERKEVYFDNALCGEINSLKEEVYEIKKLLKKVLSPSLVDKEYVKLIEKGVPPFMAKEILKNGSSLEDFIEKRIKEMGVVPHPKYQLFIGEAGTGKTTGIFKLAAWYKYNKEAEVLVVSFDSYKVGGDYQAKRISEFLEVDFEVMDPETFKEIAPALKNYKYVLIDTPGLGERLFIEDYKELCKSLKTLRIFWVVKSTDQPDYNLALWKRLKELPVEGIFLTFVDRIYSAYPLLWLLMEELPPVHFLSTGERVPEDIAPAEKDYLLKIFLKGIKV